MQSDEPVFLPVGTEVSAKFKGAFCEAKVKKINKSAKIKVRLKCPPRGSVIVDDSAVKGLLELNSDVEVLHGKQYVAAVIQHLKDCSTYHVVFNDGDEKTLRRTQMVLKGGKHFDAAQNLDALPLYNPEQFGTPVMRQTKMKTESSSPKKRKADSTPTKRPKKRKEESDNEEGKSPTKREKRAAASAASVAIGEIDMAETENSASGSSMGGDSDHDKDASTGKQNKEKRTKGKDDERVSRKEDKSTSAERRKEQSADFSVDIKKEFNAGDVVCVYEDRDRTQWFVGIVVTTKAFQENGDSPRVLNKDMFAVRNLQNGKYERRNASALMHFGEMSIMKKEYDQLPTVLKGAVDRARAFINNGTLPGNWTRKELFGSDVKKKEKVVEKKQKMKVKVKQEEPSPPTTKDKNEKKDKSKPKEKEKEKEKPKKKEDVKKTKEKEKSKVEASSESSSSSSEEEEENNEERDLFVAQLYKYQEENGTPINRIPHLGGREIDMYRFHRAVRYYGGFKRVCSNNLWKKVIRRMDLEGCPGAVPSAVRQSYERYLGGFNAFYKRLGWSLDELSTTSTLNSPRERRLIRSLPERNRPVSEVQKRRKSAVIDKKEDTESVKGDEELEVIAVKDEKCKEKDKETEPKDQEIQKKDKEIEKKEKEIEKKDKEIEKKDKEIEKKDKEIEKKDKEIEKKDKEIEKKDKASPAPSTSSSMTITDLKRDDRRKEGKKERDATPSSTASSRRDRDELRHAKSPDKVVRERDDSKDSKREELLSDEDGDGTRRKKERKKMGTPRGSVGEQKSDPDEGYEPANIFSHFYLGQKVRAHHYGLWYDARVVQLEQITPKDIIQAIGHDKQENELSQSVKDNLKELIPRHRVFVHYLGWNARYDEWLTLGKIRQHNKDSRQSMEYMQRRAEIEEGQKLSETLVQLMLAWSLSESAIPGDESTSSQNNTYRPRRVSMSHYEHLSSTETGARNEMKSASRTTSTKDSLCSVTSPQSILSTNSPETTVAKSPPTSLSSTGALRRERKMSTTHSGLATNSGKLEGKLITQDSEAGKSPCGDVSPAAHRESQRSRTASRTFSDTVAPVSASPCRPASPAKRAVITNASEVMDETGREVEKILGSPVRVSSQSGPIEIAEPVPEPVVQEKVDYDYASLVILKKEFPDSPAPARRLGSPRSVVDGPASPGVATETVARVLTPPVRTPTPRAAKGDKIKDADKEKECKEDSNTCTTSSIRTRRKSLRSDEGTVDEEEDKELIKQLQEAKTVCEMSRNEDSDAVFSGSETPQRTDTEDMFESPAGLPRVLSPSVRGRGSSLKRKRTAHRHSQMVVDRKYQKHKTSAAKSAEDRHKERVDDASEDEEDTDDVVFRGDSIATQRARLLRQMEADGSINDNSLLNIPDYEEVMAKMASVDERVVYLANELDQVREIFMECRASIQSGERRRKCYFEKKRERERKERAAQRGSPASHGAPHLIVTAGCSSPQVS